jgi:hypothetical protein
VKTSPLQIAIAYAAAILQMVVVFHKPIRLGDITADILQGVSLVCWVIFFVLWKRQKSAIASDPTRPAPPAPSKRIMCFHSRSSSSSQSSAAFSASQYFSSHGESCDRRSNQPMKPSSVKRRTRGFAAPWRDNFRLVAATPWISSRFPASLVRFASSRSRTPAVMLFNATRGVSLSR